MPSSVEFTAYRNKLKKAAKQIKDSLTGKDEIVDMMFVCAIAQEPMLLFGLPGTAKSKLVSLFCDTLGIKSAGKVVDHEKEPFYFSYLLTGFTEPDELFGPVNIAKLTQSLGYIRDKRNQMLPGATVVFLDEVFRANSAILNTLLTLINEHYFYEAGQANEAKVNVVFGAANLPPTRDDLAAFYSRFPIRMYSEQVLFANEQGDLKQGIELVRRGWELEVARMSQAAQPGAPLPPSPASYADLVYMQNYLLNHWKVDGVQWKKFEKSVAYNQFLQLVRLLRGEAPNSNLLLQVSLDDRKVVKMLKLFLAHALWMREDPLEPNLRDLLIFQYIADDMRKESRYQLAENVCSQLKGFAMNQNTTLNPNYPEDRQILNAAA